MNLTSENILLIGSTLLFLSLFVGKTSARFGVPVLVFFLGIGILAGSEGLGGIHFDNYNNAQFVGIIALNVILFTGGLETGWPSIKPVLKKGILLSSLGVIITALAVGFFVSAITSFSIYEGLLLGAIVSSTDSAAVFSILRSKGIALKGNLRATLELESGSNDPMAYVLTIAFLSLVMHQDASLVSIIPLFLQQIIIGAALGFIFGKVGKYVINNIKLEYEGLYIVLLIAIMFFSFSATDFIGGNGFLAVYLCGVYLGNQDLIHKKKYLKSFDSFAWLMQIILFLTLGLLVFPSMILPIVGLGLLLSAFLMFVARPLSVFLSLFFVKDTVRNKLFISWVGLRGAVPIVFATYPLIQGLDGAMMIFHIVFFISLTSVIIQGTTLPLVSRLLNVSLPVYAKKRNQTDMILEDSVKHEYIEYVIPDNAACVGKRIVDLQFPKTAIIAMIKRGNSFITPSGITELKKNDVLLIFSENKKSLELVEDCLLHQKHTVK